MEKKICDVCEKQITKEDHYTIVRMTPIAPKCAVPEGKTFDICQECLSLPVHQSTLREFLSKLGKAIEEFFC